MCRVAQGEGMGVCGWHFVDGGCLDREEIRTLSALCSGQEGRH
jgi:hypothetical protein